MGRPLTAHERVEGVWGNREVPPHRREGGGSVGEPWVPPRERAGGERRSSRVVGERGYGGRRDAAPAAGGAPRVPSLEPPLRRHEHADDREVVHERGEIRLRVLELHRRELLRGGQQLVQRD